MSRPVAPTTPAAELWTAYRHAPSCANRNRLVVYYEALVRGIAITISHRLPRSEHVDELRSDGTLGLMRAVELFDHSRGVSFERYAKGRVRGAILDGIRERDWVPRLVRDRGEVPVQMRSLSTLVNTDKAEIDGECTGEGWVADMTRDLNAAPVDAEAEAEDEYQRVCRLISLSERHQKLLRRRVAGGSLRESGAEIGVGASHACNIMRSIRQKLIAAGQSGGAAS